MVLQSVAFKHFFEHSVKVVAPSNNFYLLYDDSYSSGSLPRHNNVWLSYVHESAQLPSAVSSLSVPSHSLFSVFVFNSKLLSVVSMEHDVIGQPSLLEVAKEK